MEEYSREQLEVMAAAGIDIAACELDRLEQADAMDHMHQDEMDKQEGE